MVSRRDDTGYTMMEVMVVLAIVGVLAGLAVPGYFRTVEQTRTNEARTNLNIIHMGEKIYALNNNGNYWGAGATTVAAINNSTTGLNTDMSATYYTTVSVTANNAGSPKSYVARFTRNNVEGGDGATWFQHSFATGAASPTATEG